MSDVDLQAEELLTIKAILARHLTQAEVWAYGSRVNHTGHANSDLDLVIRNGNSLNTPINNLSELKEAFRDSHLPILIDVMDWALLPEAFHEEINKNHVVLFGADSSYR